MQTLSASDYQKLREGSKVVGADPFGDKVIKLADGNFLKLFRRKRLVSSALITPYSQRFAQNALMLKKRGIPTIEVLSVYKVPSIERTLVHYRPLIGETLRDWLATCDDNQRHELARKLGEFIAQLHKKRIYFRSLHLGNIVIMPDNCLGLIDISDMKSTCFALNENRRLRNFRHMARYRDDMRLLGDSAAILAESYCNFVGTSSGFHQKLEKILSGE